MRYFPFLLTLLLAAQPLAAQRPVLPEDIFPQLRDLIAAASARSPGMRAEALAVDEAQAMTGVADARDGIRVQAYTRLDLAYETRIGAESDYQSFRAGPNATIMATKPLFHWGAIDAVQEVARVRKKLSETNLERRRMLVAQEVRRYYLDHLLSLRSQAIAEGNIAFAARRTDVQQALLDQGQAARRSLLETQIFRLEAEEALSGAVKQARFSLAMLRELTGIEDLQLDPADLDSAAQAEAADLAALHLAATTHGLTPEEALLQAELAVERASYTEVSTRNRPKIDLVAATIVDYVDDYQFSSASYEQVPRVIGFAGIQGSWNIFDSGEVKAYKLASVARQRRVEARMDEARLRRLRMAEVAVQDAELALQQINTRARRLELLGSAVELMERQVADNMVPENDLLERKLDLERTRVELLRARVYYLLGVAELYSAATTSQSAFAQ